MAISPLVSSFHPFCQKIKPVHFSMSSLHLLHLHPKSNERPFQNKNVPNREFKLKKIPCTLMSGFVWTIILGRQTGKDAIFR